MLGSSRMYRTPMSPLPIWVASRMRCASPPESDTAERERVKALSDLKAKASKVGAAVELIDSAIAEGKSAEEIAVNVTSLVLAAADSPGPMHASGEITDPAADYVPIAIIH